MKVLNSDQMREADRKTIEDLGIPSQLLMERAGLSVVLAISERIENWQGIKVLALCGGGNNGGDGLVVARELLNRGAEVTVVMMKEPKSVESANNLHWYEKLGGEVLFFKETPASRIRGLIFGADVIVDAVFGMGFSGTPPAEIAELFEMVNGADALKVGVDIPSGVDADTGHAESAIACDITVTFATPKLGHVLPPGRFFCGQLKIADIGIPPRFVESDREVITKGLVAKLLPPRFPDSHKGTYGSTLIIAGSRDYSGAPLLTALGAAASGVGLVYVAVPEGINTVVTTHAPELIAIPVPGRYHSLKTLDAVSSILDRVSSIAIGPGLGRKEETLSLVLKLLELNKKLVIDADALNLLSQIDHDWHVNGDVVITPHPGEFARLTRKTTQEAKNNYSLAEEYAESHGVNIVLKGPTTTITDGRHTYFNVLGNSSLAKGGSGDVLTGLIAGFTAQGMRTLDAAILSVFLHARAAEVSEKDPRTFSPRDIVANLSTVYSEIG